MRKETLLYVEQPDFQKKWTQIYQSAIGNEGGKHKLPN